MVGSLPLTPPDHSELERRLDVVAALLREDVEPARFLRELLATLVQTLSAEEAAVWLRTGENFWMHIRLTAAQFDRGPHSDRHDSPPAWVTEVLSATTISPVRLDPSNTQILAGPVRHFGRSTGVLAIQFKAGDWPLRVNTLVSFCGAISDLTGEYFALQELRQLRVERTARHHWETWTAQLATATNLRQLAGIVAHDARALCAADRLTVAQIVNSRVRALAVSGVDVIDPHSTSVQSLEALARTAIDRDDPAFFPNTDLGSRSTAAWNQLTATSGTKSAVVVPVRDLRSAIVGAIVAERFDSRTVEAEVWLNQVVRAAAEVRPWWIALSERERSLWTRVIDRCRFTTSVSRWAIAVCVMALGLVLLWAIPAPLVVTAEGELIPVLRRDIFATANGVVENIEVRHGETVTAHQRLVRLRDPVLELEATRVTGELATVRARLSAVQAARIAPAENHADTTSRRQLLSGEEEDLKQQCESLAKQAELLAAERDTWTVKSPIAGQVLTWDVTTRLAARPVQRGQVLLTVGDTAGEWEIVARVRERHVGRLFSGGQPASGRSVRFFSTSDPGRTLTGRVDQIARVADINERGESTVGVTIAVDRKQLIDPRPGTTVWSRIDCGSQSLGYVWFHGVLDTIRRQIWLWW